MAIYQNPKLEIIDMISLILNSSSSERPSITPSDLSNLISSNEKRMNEITPSTIIIKANRIGVVITKSFANGNDIASANNVPKRAIDICIPIASAISFPLNQRTTAFEIVIPIASVPTPKIANPNDDHSTCVFIAPIRGMLTTAPSENWCETAQ